MKKTSKSAILTATGNSVTTIKADYVTADTIGVSYNNLPGCQPSSNGNFVSIWQASDTIPWDTPPLKTQPIDTNTQSGSMNFTDLTVTSQTYIIGYSVGPTLSGGGQEYGNICSSVYVPSTDTSQQQDFAGSLSITFVGPTSVAFGFNMPANLTPQSNKAWCGMWRADQPSYSNPPMYSIPVTIDASSGTLSFNNLEIGVGLTYTIAFFMSGWEGYGMPSDQTAMACSVAFKSS